MVMTIQEFLETAGITTRPVGVYNAPDPEKFAPLADPS